MRKRLFLIVGVLSLGLAVGSLGLFGASAPPNKAAPQNIADSRLIKVTVYPNSALVTREVQVPAGDGITELVVSPLPVRTVNNSLYSEGTNGIRILSTRFRTRQVFEDTREDVRKAQDELKKLKLAAEKLQAEMKTVEQNMMMLGKLENFTSVTTVKATENGGLNGDNIITLSKYVMEQRAERAKTLVGLKQQLQDNLEKASYVQRKLKELSAGSSKTERDAVIVVDRAAGKGGKVRLNYLVDAVSWRPQYKLRAGKDEDAVEVDYLASIMQHSGEDWTGVNLTLSNAEPMLNAAPPELAKLEVTVVARANIPGMSGEGKGGRKGSSKAGGSKGSFGFRPQMPADLDRQARALRKEAAEFYKRMDLRNSNMAWNNAAAFEQQRELMKSVSEVRADQLKAQSRGSEGPSVTYHLADRLSIPSRNDEQVIEIGKLDFMPNYYYKAVPVLTRNVYRLADMTNKSEKVLLPGEATMYQGRDFVGRMRMPLVAIGEEFTVGFGVDPQLQIQREMRDKNRTTQGGNQVLTYDYRILVSSYKKNPVKMQVWDRLPHAETETAGITLIKSTPEVSTDALYLRENRPNNLLRWDLDVAPTMNGEKALAVNYTFKLELDRQMVINKLLSR